MLVRKDMDVNEQERPFYRYIQVLISYFIVNIYNQTWSDIMYSKQIILPDYIISFITKFHVDLVQNFNHGKISLPSILSVTIMMCSVVLIEGVIQLFCF